MAKFALVILLFSMSVGQPYKTQVEGHRVMSEVISRSAAMVGPMCWAEAKLPECLEMVEIVYLHGWGVGEDEFVQDFCNAGGKERYNVYGCIRYNPEGVPVIAISNRVPDEWVPTVLLHELMHFMTRCLQIPKDHCHPAMADITSAADRNEC